MFTPLQSGGRGKKALQTSNIVLVLIVNIRYSLSIDITLLFIFYALHLCCHTLNISNLFVHFLYSSQTTVFLYSHSHSSYTYAMRPLSLTWEQEAATKQQDGIILHKSECA